MMPQCFGGRDCKVIVEYRLKDSRRRAYWQPLNPHIPFDELNMEFYSVRINKNRQYHRGDTSGFNEAYTKAVAWMILTDKYESAWEPW